MSNRDDYRTFINEIKVLFPTISEAQRKKLLRGAVQQYNISVDEAGEILEASGITIGEQVDYFQVLDLSISEFENLSEADSVHRVESAHKKLYSESLQAGGRPRADGRTEAQWRTLLNQARDVLIDTERRQLYIVSLQNNNTSPIEIGLDETEAAPEQTLAVPTEHDEISIPTEKDGMMLIPSGEFQMGSDEYDSPDDEKPAHTVSVDAFYIDKYPVTNKQYKKFIDANPQWRNYGIYDIQFVLRKYRDSYYLTNWYKGKYPSGRDEHPVNWVSWHAAMAYAKWVGKRLPTEAEWEKAARGGLVGQKFPWGNAINPDNANVCRRVGETTPVGKYTANRYGVCDIIGNVSEWCLDEWDSEFYQYSESNNPVSGGSIESIIGTSPTSKKYRVTRGGSWNSTALEVSVSYRSRLAPWKTNSFVGFRCVMSNQS